MKIALLNTSERTGGAGIACNRLMKALNNAGHQAFMLVRDKRTDDANVISLNNGFFTRRLNKFRFLYERLSIFWANSLCKKDLFAVSIANTGTDISEHPIVKDADIIHLHWINQGFLSLKDIRKLIETNKPVVWTMHDMWPCTGICHHARECDNYQTHCQHCFFLKRPAKKDLSYRIFDKKHVVYQSGKLTFIACSNWLKGRAEKSALFAGHSLFSVPNPIDTSRFRPTDKFRCRKDFNLPIDKQLILFGSMKVSDKRKGIDYMIKAAEILSENENSKDIELVIFGQSTIDPTVIFPFKVNYVRFLSNEEDMISLYNAVDIYVTPSLEENLPNTIMEAMACGTPCVGFNTGGIPEMIDHKENGYIAEYKSSEDLAAGILYVLNEAGLEKFGVSARKKVTQNYSQDIIAASYVRIYNQLI